MAGNDSAESMSTYDAFDPNAYLESYFSSAGTSVFAQHTLRCYHEAFKSLPNGLKILDYGSGPVMLATISAATKASEIVLSDYTESNRKALRQWLDADPAAFDWSPHFGYVLRELEGKGEKEIAERQEQVRRLVKAVVHCDVTQEPPIERGYDQLYDVVISSLVMESAARNHEEYVANISRLATLVKPGGVILYYGVENKQGYYSVGDSKFSNVHAIAEFATSAFRDAGFCNLTVEKFSPSSEPNKVFRFIKGTRNPS